MNAVEIIALLFAVLVLVKLSIVYTKPDFWMQKVSSPLLQRAEKLKWIYLVAALVVGYFLLGHMSIVEITAAAFFTALLIGYGFLCFPSITQRLLDDMLQYKTILKQAWLYSIIWVVLAVWVLIELFVKCL